MTGVAQNKPVMLDPKKKEKLDSLRRYWLTYKSAYHTLLWKIEENEMLLRFQGCAIYNTWELNEALYRYAESSISALYWIFPDKKDHPFVHKFLREWRNMNHHDERSDFLINQGKFLINGEPYELPLAYNIMYHIGLQKIVDAEFSLEKIATDATVSGLVACHHTYMERMFIDYELNLELPREFLEISRIYAGFFGGGKYDRFIPKDIFWEGNIH